MSNILIQVRVDEKLKTEAADIFEKLGIDLSTAIRIFLTRSVQEKGIPFSMTLKEEEYKAVDAVQIMKSMSQKAKERNIADMTLEEINAEISAVRNGGDS